ncbi:hypothetical protein HPB47_024697, partial [Ixodes persulcatus]
VLQPPAKKAKGPEKKKTDGHYITREERIFVFLSSELSRAYCLFLQNTASVFEKVNRCLQAQAPQIHVLRSHLFGLFEDILSRFVSPAVLKQQGTLLSVKYQSREAQKNDEDLFIGQETRAAISKLKPKKQQEFYGAVRDYFVTACDYIRLKFPLEDATLTHAEAADLRAIDNMSFRNVLFFVERFPTMLPQRMEETYTEALDALEMEF